MTKNNYPKYSVIMAVYYKVNPNHLKESINSILKQTYKPSQFIIVKDGMLTKEQNEVIAKKIAQKLDDFCKNKANLFYFGI